MLTQEGKQYLLQKRNENTPELTFTLIYRKHYSEISSEDKIDPVSFSV